MRGKREQRDGMKTSNRVLLALGLFVAGFIIVMTVIFFVKGSVPDTLIQYTLGGGGLEVLLLAGIKISKVLTGDKSGESEDNMKEMEITYEED